MIKWENITPMEFEELCYILLEQNGFTNLEWYGKGGGDRGRDIIGQKLINLLENTTELQKWLCQSKRYIGKKISKAELSDLFNSAREHKIDYFLLAITTTLTANMKDWVKSVKSEYSFKIIIWEDIDLKREVRKHLKMITNRFPHIIKQREVIHFYEMKSSGKTFFCDEIDEVGFYIMNDYGYEGNIKWIQEFISFIKSNDIRFMDE